MGETRAAKKSFWRDSRERLVGETRERNSSERLELQKMRFFFVLGRWARSRYIHLYPMWLCVVHQGAVMRGTLAPPVFKHLRARPAPPRLPPPPLGPTACVGSGSSQIHDAIGGRRDPGQRHVHPLRPDARSQAVRECGPLPEGARALQVSGAATFVFCTGWETGGRNGVMA